MRKQHKKKRAANPKRRVLNRRTMSMLLLATFASLLLPYGPARGQDSTPRTPYETTMPVKQSSDVGSGIENGADETSPNDVPLEEDTSTSPIDSIEELTSPQSLGASLPALLLIGVISLAPAIIMMTTSFVRIVVVLGLVRQALGSQQLPPTQVITSLAFFLTLLIMGPTWKTVYDEAIVPYTNEEITIQEAWNLGQAPVRLFMSLQIERCGNTDDVWLFMEYAPDAPTPESYDDVPWRVLLPAFMLSELKTAFLIGFQIYLPFVIVDMVVASVMTSMGMIMLPPVLVSIPMKLMLFVLLDGWRLIVGMLLESFT